MEAMTEMGSCLVGLVLWLVAVAGILLYGVCAAASRGAGCEPEHDCSNCGHCSEDGQSAACKHCVDFYPATPDWVPVGFEGLWDDDGNKIPWPAGSGQIQPPVSADSTDKTEAA